MFEWNTQTVALVIFIITYIGIILTRLPKINVDRPSAAFFGAVAMIVFGVIGFDEAVHAIDFNTIALLLGMMIIIATLELDGFFSLIAEKTIDYSRTPMQLLTIIVFVTGLASAFLVNDAVVLLFTPVIITICRASCINAVPFLIAEILSSNIGSVMTMTGNPQNMLIGINSNLTYGGFLLHLLPVSIVGMLAIIPVIRFLYPDVFRGKTEIKYQETNFNYDFTSMKFSVPIFLGVIVLFFISHLMHLSIPVIALIGGSLVLIFGRIKPSKIIKEVDWVLLLFFASLFVVVYAVENVGLMNPLLETQALTGDTHGLLVLHGLSLFLSQIVSNVPFTIVMLPMMKLANSDLLWLSLASASTLAGNATIIGAMANLIVIESAAGYGVKIKFWEFLKPGLLITVLTLFLSFGILYIQYYYGYLR